MLLLLISLSGIYQSKVQVWNHRFSEYYNLDED